MVEGRSCPLRKFGRKQNQTLCVTSGWKLFAERCLQQPYFCLSIFNIIYKICARHHLRSTLLNKGG
ncbi:hypothetical protein L798_12949 [Zootermopsis nevadensis]|uniref:Uncharacterized protein n=1 Tax=Zootermopsis nevadensis TaxID=136037 RepID=A0A067QTI3_ZOONE|nr:hypothetical protein L798_12949 [Zootermopsis nevadensis]